MNAQNKYKVIGLMSGTSLDGLDLACCELTRKGGKWNFKIHAADTTKYNAAWKQKLSTAHLLPAADLLALDAAYGYYLGSCTHRFIAKNRIGKVDLIASHGHTIFHQPERALTFQLGNGNALHAKTGLPVVFDFRNLDVTLGGQGAPLVPVGDRHLFPAYDVCLNLGGIANLSHEQKGARRAFDFCFVNMGLNFLAHKVKLEYDRHGALATKGSVQKSLLARLTAVYDTWRDSRPSLGREGFEKHIQPLLESPAVSVPDLLRTFCESIACEIQRAVPQLRKKSKLLVTGGGALNTFLIDLIKEKLDGRIEVVVPEKKIIEFKEALVFAFLGVLRLRGEINCLKSVTGATRDCCGGILAGA